MQVPSARPLFLRKHKPKQTPPPAVRPSIPICLPFVCRLQAVCKWCRAETPFQRTPSCSPLLQKADPPAKPAASIGLTRADCRHASQPNLILRVIPSAPQLAPPLRKAARSTLRFRRIHLRRLLLSPQTGKCGSSGSFLLRAPLLSYLLST